MTLGSLVHSAGRATPGAVRGSRAQGTLGGVAGGTLGATLGLRWGYAGGMLEGTVRWEACWGGGWGRGALVWAKQRRCQGPACMSHFGLTCIGNDLLYLGMIYTP